MINNLKSVRQKTGGMSQQQLGDSVAVSRQTIVAIERGDYNPSVKLALLLARHLQTSVEALFVLEEHDHA